MAIDKYIGIYHPDVFIKNPSALTIFCIIFDELHLVSPAHGISSPTDYYKNMPDKFYINAFGSPDTEYIDHIKDFYQFTLNNRELTGNVLFYEQNLICSAANSFLSKAMGAGISIEDVQDLFNGTNKDLKFLNEVASLRPELENDFSLLSAATSLKLSQDNGWVLLGDDIERPIPKLSKRNLSVKQLTSILIEECIKLSFPVPKALNSSEILELREKLRPQLQPFRMAMQRMSSSLKKAINDNENLGDIKKEAQFIVESEIIPSLAELKSQIEFHNDKFLVKVFGKVASWLPIIGKSFLFPNPDNIFKMVESIYGGVGDVVDSKHSAEIAKQKGLSFFISLEKEIQK